MSVYLSIAQAVSCCILCSEDDPVSFPEGQYSAAFYAIPTKPSPLFLVLFCFRELKPICRGKRYRIWRFWVSVHAALPSCLSLLSAQDCFCGFLLLSNQTPQVSSRNRLSEVIQSVIRMVIAINGSSYVCFENEGWFRLFSTSGYLNQI